MKGFLKFSGTPQNYALTFFMLKNCQDKGKII